MRGFVLLPALALAGCTIAEVAPRSAVAPVSADAAAASANCFEAETPPERAICASPALQAANRGMLAAYHGALRQAGMFGRDALLAAQTRWQLDLATDCPGSRPGCLAPALAARAQALADWHGSGAGRRALADYVRFRPLPGAAPQTALCAAIAAGADRALAATGAADPAAWGAAEIAGTHGPASAGPYAVALYDANVYALYQRRARSLDVGGAEILGPLSLAAFVQARSPANEGGRFSTYASQTGDYGAIDVFRSNNNVFALATDPWGSTTPAAPGEFAHAGLWALDGSAQPLCLYDTYEMPPDLARFDALPDFGAWRAALAELRASATLPLGPAALRDIAVLRADADFTVLNMPLLARAEARDGGWTPWLRRRHDAVLDALYAWSTASAANKPVFDRIFAALRPAAAALVHAYQTMEGLDADEAREAAGIAMMELLYGATVTVAPGLGGDLAAPAEADGYHPRYPILAAPQ